MAATLEKQRFDGISRNPEHHKFERTIYLVSPENPGLQERVGQKVLGITSAFGIIGSETQKLRDESGFRNSVDIKLVEENRPGEK